MHEVQNLIKIERIDNPDGSYITKEIYDNGTSCIRYWNNKKNNIKCLFYCDTNFQILEMTSNNKFKKDGSYMVKQVYAKPTSDGYQSIIGWYNPQKQKTKTKEFVDNKFKHLSKKSNRFYNQDGIIKEFIYNYTNNEYYINTYNAENKILTSFQYIDKHFSKLFCTHKYSYNDNGDYKIEDFYEQPMEGGYSYYVEHHNTNKQLISYQWYVDSSCAELGIDVQVLHNEDLSSKHLKKYYKGTDYIGIYNRKVYSKELLFNKDKQCIYAKVYGDLNFTELLSETNIEYLKNDWLKYTILYPTPQNNSDNQISEVHIMQNQYYCQSISRYEDKDRKNIISKISFDYKGNGSYIKKIIYYNENKNNTILKYNSNNQLIKAIEFEDKNFNKLLVTKTCSYYKNDLRVKDTFTEYFQEHKSKYEKYDHNGNIIYSKKCNYTGIFAYFILNPILVIVKLYTLFYYYLTLIGTLLLLICSLPISWIYNFIKQLKILYVEMNIKK